MITIGIDVGGSTTKIGGFTDRGVMIEPLYVKATDPVTSVYGALGKFTSANSFSLSDIKEIKVTGVGSSFLGNELYGCPCRHVGEFPSVGKGGLYLSGLSRAIIVSMGTGTAIVRAENNTCEYLGGTGVGGGTLMGLSRMMLGIDNIEHLVALAKDGDLTNVDLRVSDIAKQDGKLGLSADMTAANFGKLNDIATRADTALGLFNMVYETIGMMAYFAARSYGIRDIVLAGHLSRIPQATPVFSTLNIMFPVNFIIPEKSQFATVIGAALEEGEVLQCP
ncbi:MAG: type II pantothenate kinase [Ruminococcaceae bacterium]|nr:type II pantothenate kinase [Oscillospiraceae bacterium]